MSPRRKSGRPLALPGFDHTRPGRLALGRELTALRQTPAGLEVSALKETSHRLGQLIGAGELLGTVIEDDLVQIAVWKLNLPAKQALSIVRKELKSGRRRPRSADQLAK